MTDLDMASEGDSRSASTKPQLNVLKLTYTWAFSSLGKHVWVAAALGLIAFVVVTITTSYASDLVGQTTKAFLGDREAVCINPDKSKISANESVRPDAVTVANLLLPNLSTYQASVTEKQRILDQAIKAQRLQCAHATLLDRYIRNYYMAVVVSIVFAGFAAIALFLVGPKGWTASNPYVVNVLITSGAIAAFFGGFPTLFQQAAMTTAHKAQFLRYEELLDGMASHIASPRLVPRACASLSAPMQERIRTQAFSVTEFMACTDAALAALDVPFALDPGHGPDYQTIGGMAGRR